ncbi:hypothetical protein POTOM_047371 [Populus tomentosa]|uniref:Uncharacterized protein n=1 Tax=Populus tomentosa TaxID=118781 RepID=A0A8X7YKT2_POPTO|nr:hypothetical protein POTOM_047371 [Populus tomentosa]
MDQLSPLGDLLKNKKELQNVSVYAHTYYLDIPRKMYGLMRLLRNIYSWVGQALLFWFMVSLGYMVRLGERSSFKKY